MLNKYLLLNKKIQHIKQCLGPPKLKSMTVIIVTVVTAFPFASQGPCPWAWFRIQDKTYLGSAAGLQCPQELQEYEVPP